MKPKQKNRVFLSRRGFMEAGSASLLGLCRCAPDANSASPERVIDFHQHTHYLDRDDDTLVTHQRTLGVTRTVLLPAGSRLGLDARAGKNESVLQLARRYPDEFVFFANELPDIDATVPVLEKYLKLGAVGIGEQKFPVACDSKAMQLVASIARQFEVPVLMHFQHDRYNTGIQRFHTMLEMFPEVNFIGHAQTWWGNIDRHHDQTVLYPKTVVTPGGITDRLLSDYPNMYGDLSAGSGLNSMMRDEEHARSFLDRHQDRLVWASDCADRLGRGEDCIGANGLAAVRRLVPDPAALDKILFSNASRLLKLT